MSENQTNQMPDPANQPDPNRPQMPNDIPGRSDDLNYPTDPKSDPRRPAESDPIIDGEDSMDRGAVIPDPTRGADINLPRPDQGAEIPDPDRGSEIPDPDTKPDTDMNPRD